MWRQNVPIVRAFLAAASQWRAMPVGGGMVALTFFYTGLDYAGARAGIEAAGITITPEIWNGVRIMEGAALAALNGVRR